jgi:phage virion morphogenesis protein
MATIAITGFEKLTKALNKASKAMADLRPLLNLLGEKMKAQTAETFRLRRDPVSGAPWKPTGEIALAARPGGGAGAKTLYSTGGLLQSIIGRRPQIGPRSVAIGSNKKYARIHQFGGTIKPKAAQMLAIPLNRNAARAGGARRWWAQNAERRPFIARSRNGNLLIFEADRRRRRKPKPMFLLRDAVAIPPRPYLGIGVRQAAELEKVVAGHVGRTLF